MNGPAIARMVVYFLFAGICQVSGCYMLWQAARRVRGAGYGFGGVMLLLICGFVVAQLPAPFAKVFAAYGGVFVLLSLIVAWLVDGPPPTRYDILGAAVILAGIAILFFSPRTHP